MNLSILRYFGDADRERIVSLIRPLFADKARREFEAAYDEFVRHEELRYEALCQEYEDRNAYLDLQNEVFEKDIGLLFDDLPF
jgi:hypothetical protein